MSDETIGIGQPDPFDDLLRAVRKYREDEATPVGAQYTLCRAYWLAAAVGQGWPVELLPGQRCNICKRHPHQPYQPRCMRCEKELPHALDQLDIVWKASSNSTTNQDLFHAVCEVLRAWRERRDGK